MFVPTLINVTKCTNVTSNPIRIRLTAARYFPSTNSWFFNGSVLIISIVPKFRSLAIKLIEIAGIKKRKISGVMLNKARISD